MDTMETPKEVVFTIKLQPSLAEWLEQRATANRRARLREVEVILEEVRAKEMPAVGSTAPAEEMAATAEKQQEAV